MMLYRIVFLTVIPLLMMGLMAGLSAEELTLKQTDTGYEIWIGDELFAGYITGFGGAPIVYPIVGPTGKHMTRDFPMMRGYEGARTGHPHQRSLWFTHGAVNGLDFWQAAGAPINGIHYTRYRIVHQRFVKAESDGNTAVIVTENNWVGENDQVLCRDLRTLRFSVAENKRIIDFDITITTDQEQVVFGDTREGSFGLHVPEQMVVRFGQGGQNFDHGGRFVNAEELVGELTAEGRLNEQAWGKRSAWVTYYGELGGDRVGITILNHPSSFRFPTYWHVRGYGLFAANPFGIHEFESGSQGGDRTVPQGAGDHTLQRGESITLRYRVLFHKGDSIEANVADVFKEYAEMP